jgi:lipopolysaccharide export system permease protein
MERQDGKKTERSFIKRSNIKILDLYIIRKFLGTFVFSILTILAIAVVFDFSEKIDDFIENSAPFKEVITDYYLNFIPHFAVLFSPLFTFISVIFFTSRMAYNTEIIAILSSGISFRRVLVPYMISALLIAIFAFLMSDNVIPGSNKVRLDFEEKYLHKRPVPFERRHIHRQIEPGVFIYMESYSNVSSTGYNFSMEKFEDGQLVSKLMSDQIIWDANEKKWVIIRYYIRDYDGLTETIKEGSHIDTVLNMHPTEFTRRPNVVEAMSISELNELIDIARMQGETNITAYLIEKHKRIAFPFATFILTLMGVSVSSKKSRGGIGFQLGVGMALSFGYILFMQFSSQFSIGGSLSPALAAWLPNIIFVIVGVFLYLNAPK